MKIDVEATLLLNLIAQLSYQQGFITGVGQALDKKLEPMDGFLGDLHTAVLDVFETKNET